MKCPVVAVAVVSAVLTGCAAPVDIRSVGAAPEAPAFELRGPRLASLAAQARMLCPQGHQVLRQSQRLQLRPTDAGWLQRGVGWVEDTAGLSEALSDALGDTGSAQMLLQCTPRSAVPVALEPGR